MRSTRSAPWVSRGEGERVDEGVSVRDQRGGAEREALGRLPDGGEHCLRLGEARYADSNSRSAASPLNDFEPRLSRNPGAPRNSLTQVELRPNDPNQATSQSPAEKPTKSETRSPVWRLNPLSQRKRLDEIATRCVEVLADDSGTPLSVARLHRGTQLLVSSVVPGISEQVIAHHKSPELEDRGSHPWSAGECVQLGVELAPGRWPFNRVGGEAVHLQTEFGQSLGIVVFERGDRPPCALSLEHHPHLVDLLHIVCRQRRHSGSPTSINGHESFSLKAPKGVAQGNARHAELFRQLPLGESLTGPKTPFEDSMTQHFGYGLFNTSRCDHRLAEESRDGLPCVRATESHWIHGIERSGGCTARLAGGSVCVLPYAAATGTPCPDVGLRRNAGSERVRACSDR